MTLTLLFIHSEICVVVAGVRATVKKNTNRVSVYFAATSGRNVIPSDAVLQALKVNILFFLFVMNH